MGRIEDRALIRAAFAEFMTTWDKSPGTMSTVMESILDKFLPREYAVVKDRKGNLFRYNPDVPGFQYADVGYPDAWSTVNSLPASLVVQLAALVADPYGPNNV